MAQLNNFNPQEHEPSKTYEPIPVGKYPMVFTESEMKPNSKNTGSFLQLTAEIVDGPYKGRKVWARLNLENPNQTAVEIAQRDLSAICHALGLQNQVINDSAQLHGIPFMGDLKIRPAQGNYDATNEFKGYEPYQAVTQAQGAPVVPPTAPATPPTPAQMATQAATAQAPAQPAQPPAGGEFWKQPAA